MIRRAVVLTALAVCLPVPVLADEPKKPSKTNEDPDKPIDLHPESTKKTKQTKKKPKKAAKKAKKPAREIDTTSPTAKALAALLEVTPNYGTDGRVDLFYGFGEHAVLQDWIVKGFDRVESNGQLELGVGSRGAGLLLHRVHLDIDFEIEIRCRIETTASSSQLVFLVGDGKAGVIYGTSFAKRTRQGYRSISRRMKVDRSPFHNMRDVTIKLIAKDGALTCWVNGRKRGKTKKLRKKLPGRVGLFVTNMRLVVSSFTIRGEIDAPRLRRAKS